MSKEINAIELFCENLDWIRIPFQYIETIKVFQTENDSNIQIRLVLKSAANTNADRFESDMHCIDTGEGSLFERLQNPDITQITLCYTDQTKDDYYVVWEDWEDNEYHNRFQTTAECDNGSLLIRICKEV